MENIPSPPAIEELIRKVRDLERRVANLELGVGTAPIPVPRPPEGRASETVPKVPDAVGALPVVGRALLGIAGAYLLRALAEFGTLPHSVGVTLGVLYAASWLVLAARAPTERTLAVTMHCLTSVLVLAPLLWEATLRFSVLPTWATAAVLLLFSVFGLAISWRKNLNIIAWVTTLAGMGTAAALLVATRDVVPFTAALLAIAAAIEFSACCDHWVGERWVAAILADLAVLFLTFLIARRGGVPEGYTSIPLTAAVATQITLLFVYLASTAVRTLLRGLNYTNFETFQTVAAFLLFIGGSLRVAHGDPVAIWAIGGFALFGGAFCYTVSFAVLERKGRSNRNVYTYSTFAFLLTLTGSRFLLSGAPLAAAWSLLALVSVWIGARYRSTAVKLHGALYLLLATLDTGLAAGTATHLLSADSGWEQPTEAGWVVAGATLLCYPFAARTSRPDNSHWVDWLSILLVAALFGWTAAFVSTALAIPVLGAHAAAAKTPVFTLLVVALAWFGRRWGRQELCWLTYPFMLLIGYRILACDLTRGHTMALFVSLLVYGTALVRLPKILTRR